MKLTFDVVQFLSMILWQRARVNRHQQFADLGNLNNPRMLSIKIPINVDVMTKMIAKPFHLTGSHVDNLKFEEANSNAHAWHANVKKYLHTCLKLILSKL